MKEIRFLFVPSNHVAASNTLSQRGHLTFPTLLAGKDSLVPHPGHGTILFATSLGIFVHAIVFCGSEGAIVHVSVGNASWCCRCASLYHASAAPLAGDFSLRIVGSKMMIWPILLTNKSNPNDGSHFMPRQIRPVA